MQAKGNASSSAVIPVIFATILLLALAGPWAGTALAASGWEQQFTANSGIYSVSAADNNAVWATQTLPPQILRSVDGGVTWKSMNPPMNIFTFPTSLAAVDANTAWLIGNTDATIFKTIDGGQTWATQFYQPGGYMTSISAVDANTAWAMCTKGTTGAAYTTEILKTENGGATWSIKFSYTSSTFQNDGCISSPDSNVAWAIGGVASSGYRVWTTSDGGTGWTDLPLTSGASTSICAIDGMKAWAADYRTVQRTDDGGNKWETVLTIPAPLAGGSSGASGTSGTTFSSTRLVAFGMGVAWVAVDAGRVFRTTDNGLTWSQQPTVSTMNFSGMSAADANTAWATGWDSATGHGAIFHTTDGGGQPVQLPPRVTAISPVYGANSYAIEAQVQGTGFMPGASVRLERGSTVINAADVVVDSDSHITCKLDPTGQPLGKYDVIVKNPDGKEGKLARGFSVTDICGQGGGASICLLAGLLGLLSVAGLGWRLRRHGG